MKMEHATLAAMLVMVSIVLVMIGGYMLWAGSWIIGPLLIVVAIDLYMTVCWDRPLIKKGPIGKFLYPKDK